MSLDLYQRELSDTLSRMGGTKSIEPGVFDGFIRGSGIYAMKGLAKTARAIDMAGAVFPMLEDAFTGGTEAQDRYFREHDEVFGGAVDHWTPRPLEVGTAAEIVGGLVSQLPIIVASPHLAVGSTLLSTAEDLAAKGVEPGKAIAVGATQAAGLGVGIWMPVLGQNAVQRILLGGAGFNLAQGVGTRAAAQIILDGSPAAKEFEAFDWKAMTLDTLLGAAFGTLVHLSPAQRAQGAEAWTRIQAWAQKLEPSQVAALAALRTAQHLNADSLAGRPAAPADIEAHANRVRTAIDQLASDKPVEVGDLPAAELKPDARRFVQAGKRFEELEGRVERVAKQEGIEPIPETEAPAGQPRGAEPPPPRGSSEGKPAGAEATAPDPVATEAMRIATEHADLPINLGTDAEGKPIVKTAAQFLADAEQSAKALEGDQSLIHAAAACLLGLA